MGLAIDLAGRHAVVTGAGTGIGQAISLALARAGADVFGVGLAADELERVGEQVRSLGVRYGYAVADLRDPAVCARVAREAESFLGDVDVLVNNAGVALTAPIEDVTEADWDATLDVNVKAAFFLTQAIGRGMVSRGRGRIINIASQAALVGLHDHAAYCASKAAIAALTKVLAIEWGPRGVATNAVAPTVILTELGQRVWGDPAKSGPMLAKIPIRRFGQPSEVAAVVAFLASDLASLMNGEIVAVNGGYTAQ
jgi:NAD(P)-dependent dehydrogenase (short-subunit alcohol dehydrogenase family)